MASTMRSQSPEYDSDQGLKRKRESEVDEKTISKSKKKRKNKSNATEDIYVNDYIAQRTRKYETELSPIELEDRYISEKAIVDTTSWTRTRDLEGLPDFLRHFTPIKTQLTAIPKIKGAPHTILVTSSGLRAANLTRALRTYQSREAVVAKLFAKHIKLKEAIGYVRSTYMGIGVGTPQRLSDLHDEGALNLDCVQRVIIDCSYVDAKNRGILDMRETQVPLVTFLNIDTLKMQYGQKDDSGIRLSFY